jgi:hypothetical protein
MSAPEQDMSALVRVRFLVLIEVLFLGIALTPIVLHSLEYQTSTPVKQLTVKPASNPSPQVSYTVDSLGHKHWTATIYQSIVVTESISWVKHSYILGIAADGLDSANIAKDINEMYYALLVLAVAAFLLLGRSEIARVKPQFLSQ